MAWIKTIKPEEASGELRELMMKVRELYPSEYATPAPKASGSEESIIESHTLMPETLFHIFAGYGSMLSPDLPLERRQHEMIATMVSITNSCHY